MTTSTVGVTGHSNLAPACLPVVAAELGAALRELGAASGALTGVSCLAPGADQVFARVLLELGGRLEVVLPALDYRDRLAPEHVADFDALRAAASAVTVLPFARSGRRAYVAANQRVLDRVDHLVAVWDGQPAGGAGGTGDVVARARAAGLPVRVVWPAGAARD
ncbi:hypothetical protein [Goodfellowiella coeruleoviolacea]|uniref:hypothetical protein n=1 Tax=Goodfellowiella coeruleoviolacea TaxID=334858 RepID=UPI0020A3A645|nr:hypothetical protein [Goodfellowiella coeruleoviolacea]